MVNRINSEKKVKRNLGTFSWWLYIVCITCFQGLLGDVLRTSWGHPKSASQRHCLDVISSCPHDVISGRLWDIRSGRPQDDQIGFLWDVLETLERNALETSLEPTFAGWVTVNLILHILWIILIKMTECLFAALLSINKFILDIRDALSFGICSLWK